MKGKGVHNGVEVGGSVGQVVVVVVRLQGVNQNIRINYAFAAVGSVGKAVERFAEDLHHAAVAVHVAGRSPPCPANDLTIRMHLSHQILRIDFGIDIVATNNHVRAVQIESHTQHGGVRQGDRINIRVSFPYSSVTELRTQGVIKIIGDGMAIFVVNDIGHDGQGIASSGLGVEIDAVSVEKSIAVPVGSLHLGGQRDIQGREGGQETLHVVVHLGGMVISTKVGNLVPKGGGSPSTVILYGIS